MKNCVFFTNLVCLTFFSVGFIAIDLRNHIKCQTELVSTEWMKWKCPMNALEIRTSEWLAWSQCKKRLLSIVCSVLCELERLPGGDPHGRRDQILVLELLDRGPRKFPGEQTPFQTSLSCLNPRSTDQRQSSSTGWRKSDVFLQPLKPLMTTLEDALKNHTVREQVPLSTSAGWYFLVHIQAVLAGILIIHQAP